MGQQTKNRLHLATPVTKNDLLVTKRIESVISTFLLALNYEKHVVPPILKNTEPETKAGQSETQEDLLQDIGCSAE